jgi:CIC family chloride channel protein
MAVRAARSAAEPLIHLLRELGRRLGYVERWLVISIISAIVGSLFIGLFYVLERLVVALSAFLLNVHGKEVFMHISDFSVIALMTENKIIIPILALVGALVSALIVYFLEPEAEGGGTDAAVHTYHHRAGIIRPRVALVKAVASALLLGMGGSAGPEGPAIQIGASAGSSIARFLGMSVEERKIMLVAGMAAALSFIFRSPVGSAIFAVEVLYMRDMELNALVPALFASVIAYALSIHILGPGYKLPSINIGNIVNLYSASALASYVATGLMVAPFAYLYIKSFEIVKTELRRLVDERGLPRWLRPVIGVSVVGMLGVAVPYILGTGEETLSHMLSEFQHGRIRLGGLLGGSLVLALFTLAILKIIATSLTVGSGGSGGLLAPGLFAGAMVGEAVGLILSRYTGLSPAVYAYLGMASLFGAASKVSIGLSFFVAEIGGTPALIVPALITSLTASLALGSISIVESQLPHRIPPNVFTVESILEFLRERGKCIRVKEFTIRSIPAVVWTEKLSQAVRRLIRQRLRVIPVVDERGRVVGVLDPGYIGLDIRYALKSEENVAEVSLREAPIVHYDDCVTHALEEMIIYGTDYVVVVGEGYRYQGMILLEDLISALLPTIVEEVRSGRALEHTAVNAKGR